MHDSNKFYHFCVVCVEGSKGPFTPNGSGSGSGSEDSVDFYLSHTHQASAAAAFASVKTSNGFWTDFSSNATAVVLGFF